MEFKEKKNGHPRIAAAAKRKRGRQIKIKSGSANKMPLKTKRQGRGDETTSRLFTFGPMVEENSVGSRIVEKFFGKFQASHLHMHNYVLTHTATETPTQAGL